MDRERNEEILNECGNLATYYINSIIEQVAPEISQDFPGILNFFYLIKKLF